MRNIKLILKDCVCHDEIIYGIARDYNVIISHDINTHETKLLTCIPNIPACASDTCGAVSYFNDKLIILPNYTTYIWFYDINSQKLEKYERNILNDNSSGGMLQSVLWNDNIYFIGSYYPAIIRYNMQSSEYTYITKPFDEAGKRCANISDAYFRTHSTISDNNLYLASCFDNYVLKFNLDNEKYEWIRIGNAIEGFSGIAFDGNTFWLAPRNNGSIIEWDGKNILQEIKLLDSFYEKLPYFLGVCYFNKTVIFPNQLNTNSILINIDRPKQIMIQEHKYTMLKKLSSDCIISQYSEGTVVFETNSSKTAFELIIDMEDLLQHWKKYGINQLYKTYNVLESNIINAGVFINFIGKCVK